MNVAEKESIRIYQNYLIGGETEDEKAILYHAIKGALEWGEFTNKKIALKKTYLSPLSLSDNMIVLSETTGYPVNDIISGIERKYSEARKIFCYISSGNHNPQEIAYFLEKARTTVIYLIGCISSAISVNNKEILRLLDRLDKTIHDNLEI